MTRLKLGDAMRIAREDAMLARCHAKFKRYYYGHIAELKARKARYYEENKEMIRMKNHEYYVKTRACATAFAPARSEVSA